MSQYTTKGGLLFQNATLREYMALKKLITEGWKHASTIIFFGGFITDSFLLPDVTDPTTKYIGLAYLCILATIIILREWIIARNTASVFEQRTFSVLTFGVSFFSGAALSFVFIYAMRSAALSVSWPLFVILLLCMAANEFVDTHEYRFTLDIAVFFVALVFYAIFNVPIATGSVNDSVFLLSIAIAIGVGILFISVLRKLSEVAEYERGRGYALAVGIPMFVGMLYFLNIIPAVPLTLKESGVYHIVTRTPDGEYIGQKEVDARLLAEYRQTIFHKKSAGDVVYFFSSVGAPAEVSAPVTHVWEYYDEATHEWITSTIVSFDLSGGREEGYRAYSKKETTKPGLWRVTVKVDTNRVVGRMQFRIEEGSERQLEEVKL
ncbi:MAG: hypothetical protein RIQ41_236 [Candidatus Parcubacteria bacterium]|jgi:hypothetical protein